VLHISTACTIKFSCDLEESLFQSFLPLVILPYACWCKLTHACSHEPNIGVLLQGQYACVMITHEDIEDDAHWISWLRHSAQVCLSSSSVLLHKGLLPCWLGRPGPGQYLVHLQTGVTHRFRVQDLDSKPNSFYFRKIATGARDTSFWVTANGGIPNITSKCINIILSPLIFSSPESIGTVCK